MNNELEGFLTTEDETDRLSRNVGKISHNSLRNDPEDRSSRLCSNLIPNRDCLAGLRLVVHGHCQFSRYRSPDSNPLSSECEGMYSFNLPQSLVR